MLLKSYSKRLRAFSLFGLFLGQCCLPVKTGNALNAWTVDDSWLEKQPVGCLDGSLHSLHCEVPNTQRGYIAIGLQALASKPYILYPDLYLQQLLVALKYYWIVLQVVGTQINKSIFSDAYLDRVNTPWGFLLVRQNYATTCLIQSTNGRVFLKCAYTMNSTIGMAHGGCAGGERLQSSPPRLWGLI